MWGAWFLTLLLVIAVAIATESGEPSLPVGGEAAATGSAPVETIARRVEAIRELEFADVPAARSVSAAEARREGLDALDRDYPPDRRRADAATLELLGLVEPGLDLREVAASVYEGQVAGYYDPRTGRLRVVEGPGSDSGVYTEIVLAHELTHALEDQAFGLREDELSGLDDRSLAYAALVEGTASALMFEYADRHFTAGEVLGGLLGSAFAPPPDIPSFIQAQLTFPYLRGRDFAERLFRAAGGEWTLVDAAFETRPPSSTEHVLHPEAYLRFEDPLPVSIDAPAALGAGWRRAVTGRLGEWQTAEVLARAGGGGAREAAEGWGGDRYELWSREGEDALVARWRWDSREDQAEFEEALRAWAASDAPGGEAAVAVRGGAVTLAVARDGSLATRLARAPG